MIAAEELTNQSTIYLPAYTKGFTQSKITFAFAPTLMIRVAAYRATGIAAHIKNRSIRTATQERDSLDHGQREALAVRGGRICA